MPKTTVTKVELPLFNEANNHMIDHAFLCNIPFNEALTTHINNHAHRELKQRSYVLPQQIHSNICLFVDEPSIYLLECDALVTNKPHLVLGIRTLDCLPIILSDPVNRVIGAVHAGWKGLKHGIIENTIAKMLELGSDPKYLTAAIGPCILQKNYEVQEDFLEIFGDSGKEFTQCKGDKYYFDLTGYCKKLLQGKAIKEVYEAGIDTYSNPGTASYRYFQQLKQEPTLCNISTIVITPGETPFYDAISVQDIENKSSSCDSNAEQDTAIWKNFTQDLTKISDKFAYPPHSTQNNLRPAKALSKDIAVTFHQQNFNTGSLDFDKPADPEVLRKIKRGKISVEKILDLHGETEESAHCKTIRFILESYTNDLRYLLIIVGKGRNGRAIIKESFNSWLKSHDEIRDLIMLVSEALPHHGGEGAYYVFLRRKRNQ